MPVWSIGSIEDRPEVTLRDWVAFEGPLHGPDQPWTRHLAGWSCEAHQGQVSSAMQKFDPLTSSCITTSGRVYRLLGLPRLNADAAYVWKRRKRIADIAVERDFTQDVLGSIQAAKASSVDPQGGRESQ